MRELPIGEGALCDVVIVKIVVQAWVLATPLSWGLRCPSLSRRSALTWMSTMWSSRAQLSDTSTSRPPDAPRTEPFPARLQVLRLAEHLQAGLDLVSRPAALPS